MTDVAPTSVRALGCVGLLYGSAQLLSPGALLGDAPEARVDRGALVFSGVLGATALTLAGVRLLEICRHLSPLERSPAPT